VSTRLAWVTTRAARGLDLDEPLGLAALTRRGATVDVVDWDDPDVDWPGYDRVVIRSTWDYQDRLPAFLAWVEATAQRTDVRNPPPLVRWSSDKHYLEELAAAGVPVPPSTFLEPGDPVRLERGPVVVKPAVGAGSRGVAAYAPGQEEAAAEHVARLHALGRSALVQPRLASVARDGERALVHFGGSYSHAAAKRVTLPRPGSFDELFAAEETAPHEATPAELAVAGAAMDVVAQRWGVPAYARVDLVHDDDGAPLVLELELVEPSLFLAEGGPGAPDRLAASLLA
jgi:glutathione synthase/RimK-type ligase-like ATP-grasp enzyme